MRFVSWFVFLFPILLSAQTEKCAQSNEVHNLLKQSRALADEWALDTALLVGNQAEILARTECGTTSLTFAYASANLARTHYYLSNYNEAAEWYQRSLTIQEEKLGKFHPDYLENFNRLAVVYDVQGNYPKADTLYREVLRLFEEANGRLSQVYIKALYNLATMYETMGNYNEAEQLLLESLELQRKAPEKDALLYANNLQSLGALYINLGQLEKSEEHFLEAEKIYETENATEEFDYLFLANNMGGLYSKQDRYSEALVMYGKAQRLIVQFLGETHPNNAFILNAIGVVYMDSQQYEKAEETFTQVLGIIPPESVDYGLTKLNFAKLYLQTGAYEQAAIANQEADLSLAQWWSPSYATRLESLNMKGTLAWLQGDTLNALADFKQHADQQTQKMLGYSQYLTAEELMQYLPAVKSHHDLYLSLAEEWSALTGVCYDKALFYKGYVLQSSQRTRQLIQAESGLQEDYEKLLATHNSLAEQYALPLNEQQDVETLERELNVLQKELIRRSAPLAQAWQQTSWQEVKAQLAENEIAIEFVHYTAYNPLPTDTVRYAALLVSPQLPHPQFVSLCTKDQLESLLVPEPNKQYTGAAGKALYDALWQPLQKFIDSALPQHKSYNVYYSNSGLFHRLQLAALPAPQGEALGLVHQFRLMGSTRQLVVEDSYVKYANNKTALLYGGIDYQLDSTALGSIAETTAIETDATLPDNLRNAIMDGAWPSLPWTKVEVTLANDQLKEAGYAPNLRLGKEATEDYLKQRLIRQNDERPSPYILHFATHAYFFQEGQQTTENTFAAATQPLIRSGLLLAGADYAWEQGRPFNPAREDGVLTAYELSQLPLNQTELVVLSACETGRGAIAGFEGVFGLQRACKIAGARYLIMSLWEIPDFQSQAFMTDFYKNWLEEKMTIPKAFATTQLSMRKKFKAPQAWAGFVLLE